MASETFATRGVVGNSVFVTGADGVSSAGNSGVVFSYDAGTGTYTVANAGTITAFAGSSLDPALSNDKLEVYRVGTQTLTLSKPGTTGSLTYRYVGSGYWQQTNLSTNTTTGILNAFVYGMPTADASLRRTGAATYAIDVQAAIAYLDDVNSYVGTGNLLVDFETLAITYSGTGKEVSSAGVFRGDSGFMGEATLSSTANAFNGFMSIGPYFRGGPNPGAMLGGMFYGPNTNEVGATFFGTGQNNVAVVGTLMGRFDADRPSAATNTSLVNLTKDVVFRSGGASRDVRYDFVTRTYIGDTSFPATFSQFEYNAATNTYTLLDSLTSDPFQAKGSRTFAPANVDAALSTDAYTTYVVTSGNITTRLDLYRPAGSANPIQLTYTGWGHRILEDRGAASTRADTWFVYTLPTNGGGAYAIPNTGSATYTGTVFGTATPNLSGNSLGNLSGTATLAVDFAGNTFTGSMAPVMSLLSDNSTRALGTYTFSMGTLTANALSATIVGPGDDRGSLAGWLTGNGATEFGANFSVDTFATPAAVEYALKGVIVGRKN